MRIITFCGFLAMAAILSIGYRAVAAVERVVYTVADVCMIPFRMDWGVARRFIDRWALAAFRMIGLLKPEYDESLESDGQNFETRLRFASRC